MEASSSNQEAPHATEWPPDLVGLRSHRRTAEQEVHELGPRKTKRGIKISRRGIKSEPPCFM